MESNNERYTEFQKRAIDLLVHKFIFDYDCINQKFEAEIESTYEEWARAHIREIYLREQVWRGVMTELLRRNHARPD